MPWLLFGFWALVSIVALGSLFIGYRMLQEPERFFTKIRTNPLMFYLAAMLLSLGLSWFTSTHTIPDGHVNPILEKAAFIFATGVVIRYLGACADFADMFTPNPDNIRATRLDINVAFLLMMTGFVTIGLFGWVGVENFADHAIESVVTAIMVGLFAAADIYRKKDDGAPVP